MTPKSNQEHHHHQEEQEQEQDSNETTTKNNPWEALLGNRLLTKVAPPETWKKPNTRNFRDSFSHHGPESPTAQALQNKDFVLLYFSAAWCPPCQKFSPLLKKFYNHAAAAACSSQEDNTDNDDIITIEIIYVSADRDLREFQEYYSQMPWLALESQRHKTLVTRKCHVQGIPSLVVLTGDGKFVTDQGRTEVTATGGKPEKVRALLHAWKQVNAVPLEEAPFSHRAPLCAIL